VVALTSDIVADLKAFGLSSYEAQAYTSLLRVGPAEAADVARDAEIPSGRIYDVLNTLVERNLLHVQEGRPKRYDALPPKVALQTLLRQRKREFEDRYDQLTKKASEVEQRLAGGSAGRDSAFYHVCLGESQAREFLVETIEEAEEEIAVSLELERYDPDDERLFQAFADAAERGVDIRVLFRDEDVGYVLDSPLNDLVSRTVMPYVGDNVSVRVIEDEQVPFGVVDGEKALIGVKNPLDPEVYFALVYVWDAGFAEDLLDRFEQLWEGGDIDVGDLLAGVDVEAAVEAALGDEGLGLAADE
jgi:sugar-specific transcriptional regulator TrmB